MMDMEAALMKSAWLVIFETIFLDVTMNLLHGRFILTHEHARNSLQKTLHSTSLLLNALPPEVC